MTNASARATEKAKTYDDFEWEKLARNNKLGNLCASQLNLYLMANLNMSRKDCDKKGFTKALKLEEIKKHFYSSRHDDDANGGKRPSIHVALSSSITGTKDESALVKVPPWSGTIWVPYHRHVNLVNTCPIDNFLTIFYVLMKKHSEFYQLLSRSAELYTTALIRICQLFDKGKFVDGKCEWLKLFAGWLNLIDTFKLDL